MFRRNFGMSRKDFERYSEPYLVASLLFFLVLSLLIGWPTLLAWFGTVWGMKLFRDNYTER